MGKDQKLCSLEGNIMSSQPFTTGLFLCKPSNMLLGSPENSSLGFYKSFQKNSGLLTPLPYLTN
jgi:hypothetical protein